MSAARRVGLVTGCGSGIGRAIAKTLARSSHDLVLNDLPPDRETVCGGRSRPSRSARRWGRGCCLCLRVTGRTQEDMCKRAVSELGGTHSGQCAYYAERADF